MRIEKLPIGGINHKIEGFFQVCKAKGLTGEQGVMIPDKNVSNLMLREDVVEAVRGGKFHVYSVQTIDEGIEILTGAKAGERQSDGSTPKEVLTWISHMKVSKVGHRHDLYDNIASEKPSAA